MASRRASRRARLDDRVRSLLGARNLAGVDEVGRGCLAGPVVVATVILPPGLDLPGVRDSKKMSLPARERAYLRIREECIAFAVRAVPASEVDRLNVLAASLKGMTDVVAQLERRRGLHVDHVLVDGHQTPAGLADRATTLVKGDDRSLCIAAASVVAKVVRDRLMRSWGRRHPAYGFERHVGYPTPEHLLALRNVGPCRLHRRSFAPVAAAELQRELGFEDAS